MDFIRRDVTTRYSDRLFAFLWFGWLPMVAGSQGITPFKPPLFQVLLLLPAVAPAVAAVIVTAVNEGTV
jgi:hypothetical protein